MDIKRRFDIFTRILLSALVAAGLWSCQSDKDNPEEGPDPVVDVPETTLADLKADLDAAVQASKRVKSISPVVSGNKGWNIVFSDNSKITVQGTENAKSPVVSLSGDDCWQVTYDNGATYEVLKYINGSPVKSLDESTGESVFVKLQTKYHGRYLFEIYHMSDPTKVVARVESKISSNSQIALFAMVVDDVSGMATVITSDLQSYDFTLSDISLRSAALSTTSLSLTPGSTAELILNIAPASIPVRLDAVGDAYGVSLVGENGAAPANITLETITPVDDAPGSYKLLIKDSGRNKNYAETIAVKVADAYGTALVTNQAIIYCDEGNVLMSFTVNGVKAVRDGQSDWLLKFTYGTAMKTKVVNFEVSEGSTVSVDGKQLTSGSSSVSFDRPINLVVSNGGKAPDRKYVIYPHFSSVPVLYLQSPRSISSKTVWVENCTMQIGNAGEFNIDLDKVQLRGRGNSTWGYPKKPYAIKLDSRTKIMGMPKHKRWVLLANWLDKTVMRNALAFEVARTLGGMAWTPSGTWVDVVLNGQYIGNYYLCEQIRIDKNRVNIDELTTSQVSGEALTGGYLMEVDTYFDEPYRFRSAVKGLPFNLKSPDENVPGAQINYITNYVGKIEDILYKKSDIGKGDIWNHIDMDSFIDWWIVNEVARNWEPNHPKSSYMHKARSGLMYAGPVWDFDWATFQTQQTEYTNGPLIIKGAIWYDRLFQYPEFVARVKERWAKCKPLLEAIPTEFIDVNADKIRESAEANSNLWPISSGVNTDYRMSFTAAVAAMRSFYINRIAEMDRAIKAL